MRSIDTAQQHVKAGMQMIIDSNRRRKMIYEITNV